MNIKIRSKDYELTPAIEEYINKKLGSLDKFFGGDNVLCEVEIGKSTEHHKSGDIFSAEVNISQPGSRQFYAKSEQSDLYSAVDMVRDDAEREIVSEKNKKETIFRKGALKLKNIIKGLTNR
ncbi:MAG: ribosome-associated translation inhibitor RaiA [Minisyncoccia bacterium]